MKILLVVCLGALLFCSAAFGAPGRPEAFSVADRVGELNERCFFLFSTSAGNYIVRHDGMGEFSSPKGMRRVFTLKVGPRGRIDRVYFLEHQGDLFLLYDVHDTSYLVRMEQSKRKVRWLTMIESAEDEAPAIEGEFIMMKNIVIAKANGQVRQD
jgi:hypothetical protein